MHHIDPFSITVFNSIISFVIGTGLFVVSHYVSYFKGIRQWAMALLLLCISFILLALFEFVPTFFSVVVDVTALSLGLIFYTQSIVEFKEYRVNMRWLYAIAALGVIGNIYFVSIDLNMAAKIAVTSTTMAILLLISSFFLHSKPQQGSLPVSHRFTSFVFAFTGFVSLMRAIYYALINSQAHQGLFDHNIVQDIFYLTSAFFLVGSSFGFLLMFGEKYVGKIARIKNELQLSEQRFRDLFESAPLPYQSLDIEGNFLHVNQAWLELVGCQHDEVIGQFFGDFMTESSKKLVYQTFSQFKKEGHVLSPVFELERRDTNETRLVIVNGRIARDSHGLFQRTHCILRDVTEQYHIEQELKRAETELRIAATVFESQVGMFITDIDGNILKVNHAFTEITGYSADEVIGKNPRLLNSGRQNETFYNTMWQTIHTQGAWQGEIWNRRKNGEIYPEWETITAVKANGDDNVSHYVATLSDITEQKNTQETIKQLAFYDPLTNLPNRRLLYERIKHAIEISHRTGQHLAVLMLDLDKFKAVNDTLGHAAGDDLLQQVAQRISGHLREMDTVARLGGDEFVVLLENISHAEQAAMVANNIVQTLKQPFTLCQTQQVSIGTSIGIALYPQHGSDIETLMDNADTALYQAKDNGRGCFAYFGAANLSTCSI